MTLAQLRTAVFRKLEEDPVTPVYWTVADVDAAINEGYEEISDISEWFEQTENIAFTTVKVNSLSALLSRPFLFMRRVYNDISNIWMEMTHWRILDQEYREWDKTTGTPEHYLISGLDRLKWYPRPAVASGNGAAHYAAIPALMTDPGHTPGFPEEFQQGLVDYACYDLLCQEKEFKKAERYWQGFMAYADGLKNYVDHRLTRGRAGMLGGAF